MDLLAVLAAAAGISTQDLQTDISAAADARKEQEASRGREKTVYQDRELVAVYLEKIERKVTPVP